MTYFSNNTLVFFRFIFVLIFSLCFFSIDIPAHAKHKNTKTLILGTAYPLTEINPLYTRRSMSKSILGVLFNGLVRIKSDGSIEPDLAYRWDISDDWRTYDFYLREKVFFHDGVELTAQDVLFSFNSYLKIERFSFFQEHFESVESLEAVSPYHIRIVLKKPVNNFLAKLAINILPQHIYQDYISNNSFEGQEVPVVGTGPYQFEHWGEKRDYFILKRYENYHEQKALIETIKIQSYPSKAYLWLAFMRGDVHMVKYLDKMNYDLLLDDPMFRRYEIPWDSYYAVVYDMKDSFLSEKKARQAIAHAIDVSQILNNLSIQGILSTGPFHPHSASFNPEVKAFEYDPGKSRQILESLGWKDSDQDGIFDRNGENFQLRMLVNQNVIFYKKLLLTLRQQLAQLSIELVVIYYDDESDLDSEFLKKEKPNAWLRLFPTFGLAEDYGDEVLRRWTPYCSDSMQLWSYQNEKVSLWFEKAGQTQDANLRQKIFRKAHQLIYEDQPVLFLFFPMSFHAVKSQVQNTDEFFSFGMPIYTLKNWSF